jgi:uncharacterized membrane protein YhhN
VTFAAWICLVVAAVAAVVDWWSCWVGHRAIERCSKPLALAALIGVAIAIEPADDTVRWWFVAALVLSLAGDILLLDDARFVAGLAAFLVAHLAYIAGFVAAPDWSWGRVVVASVPIALVAATVGRRVVAGARRTDRALGPPVVAYQATILTMLAAAIATGDGRAVVGASLFVASDSLVGWNAFVSPARWMGVAIMVTYHLGQLGLVLSLLPGR